MSLNLDTVEVLDANRGDLEQRKFLQDSKNNIALRTVSLGNLLAGYVFDYISVAYPTGTTEVYTFKTGGSGGTTVATITVTYTTTAKDVLSSVARS